RTRAEAEQLLLDLLIQPGKGPSSTSMSLWACLDQWIQDGKARGWAPATLDRYVRLMELHARPLGHTTLADIKPIRKQSRLTDMLGDGLSPTTVNNFFRALRSALNRAVELGMLQSTPTDGVRPPRSKSRTDAAITPAQALAIIQAAREAGSRWWLAIA